LQYNFHFNYFTMFKQLLYTTVFLTIYSSTNAQSLNQSLLVGNFSLVKLELSQQYDSNLVKIPPLVWTLYDNYDLSESLSINNYYNFKRSVVFKVGMDRVIEGSLAISQDTIRIYKGTLFTADKLLVEKMNQNELVLIEKHKMRQVRRTFRRQ
jgi:hypothetical protein